MKEWWQNLTDRDRKIMVVGTIVVLLLLLYQFLWTPMDDATDNLRGKVLRNQNLLSWMQASDKELKRQAPLASTQHPSTTSSSSASSASMLTMIKSSLDQYKLASTVSQLHQAENGVQIHFEKIAFDDLASWLNVLNQEDHISAVHLSATALGNGLVNAQLTLEHA